MLTQLIAVAVDLITCLPIYLGTTNQSSRPLFQFRTEKKSGELYGPLCVFLSVASLRTATMTTDIPIYILFIGMSCLPPFHFR